MPLVALITIFGWAFFSFWSAIPAGVALNVEPLAVVLATTLSYGSGAALVVIVGAPLRERIQRRLAKRPASAEPEDGTPQPSRMMRLIYGAWERFGMIGLALLAPITVGSQIGAVIGLSLGARPIRLIAVMTAGALVWAVVLVVALRLGVGAVTS